MYSITVTKSGENWFCYKINMDADGKNRIEETITTNSYSLLMHEAANKGWIDLMNNNE